MWQKNVGGRAREGKKVSAEARNPTDKEFGWVLWAKEGEDVMKSLRIKGPKKKFWQKPFRMPVRGTGRVSAAERCGSFEILENQGTQKKRFGEPHLGCQFGVWARLGGGALR